MHFCSGVITSRHCRSSKAWVLPVLSSGHSKGSGAFCQALGNRDQCTVCIVLQRGRVCSLSGCCWTRVVSGLGSGGRRHCPWGCSCPSESCGPRGSWLGTELPAHAGPRSGFEDLLCFIHSAGHIPMAGHRGSCFSMSLPTLVSFFFWIIAMLTGVKWYLIAALFSVVDHKNDICSLSLEYS